MQIKYQVQWNCFTTYENLSLHIVTKSIIEQIITMETNNFPMSTKKKF